MYKRSTTTVKCGFCNRAFERENRSLKEVNFCTSVCANRHRVKNFNPLNYNINIAKKNAKIKNLEFDLKPKKVLEMYNNQEGKCALTGVLMVFVSKEIKQLRQVSIDRIDMKKGYTLENIQLVTLGANYLRNTFTVEETESFLKELLHSAN